MSDHDELGRTLRTLLLQEADTMDIDTREATERLTRELGPTSPRRPLVLVLVACALVVVTLLAWSNRGDDRRGIAPADDRDSSSPKAPYYLDLAGGGQSPVPRSVAALLDTTDDVAFSPAGDRVVYGTCLLNSAGRCFSDDQLFLANADGTGEHTLNPPTGLNAYFPAWSSDGTKLVYQARQGGVADVGNLYLHDIASGGRTQLTDLKLDLPMWWPVIANFSPDGERVLYSRPRTSDLQTTWDVWEVPVAGGEPIRLFENADTPQYLADGRIAFFRPGSGDSPDTLLAAVPGGEPEVLVEYEAEDGTAASPDGTRIAYVDNGVLHLLDLASGESDVLADADRFAWVGDDRLLVAPGPAAQ